jgi:hypothetical protein
MKTIASLFTLRYGDRSYTDKSILDNGTTPLIASQGVENGVYGFFDVPVKYHKPIITVPRTGSIGYAFVQLLPCTVTDDCIVLTSKEPVTTEYLFYVATVVRFSRWRFNYARKITPARLGRIPVASTNEFNASVSYEDMCKQLYPISSKEAPNQLSIHRTSSIRITELFTLHRGHFHAIDRLEAGQYPTDLPPKN